MTGEQAATSASEQAAASASPAQGRRPRPAISRDIEFFFEGTRHGKLLIQRCASCGVLRHPPLPACSTCRSFDWDTVEATGRGTVFSYVVVHHPKVPGFDYPLAIALVELEEGTRIVANVSGNPADVHIGMEVTAEIVAFDDELSLPVFHPVALDGSVASGLGAGGGNA